MASGDKSARSDVLGGVVQVVSDDAIFRLSEDGWVLCFSFSFFIRERFHDSRFKILLLVCNKQKMNANGSNLDTTPTYEYVFFTI